MTTDELLERLFQEGKINLQQFRTYKGQVKHGDEEACRLGLKRKGLLDGEERTEKTIS